MCPMPVSSRDLARALASRLDAVAPEGLEVRAEDDQVRVYRGGSLIGGSAAPRILVSPVDERSVETAAYSTINAIQDVFAEELTTPWPAPSGQMPPPDTRVGAGVLRAWFGPEDRPVLELAPFELPSTPEPPD